MSEPIRICVADDHLVVREGLRAFLSRQPDIRIVGEASTGEELLGVVARTRPHVALVDLLMPGIGGVEATVRLRERRPETQVVVLTSSTAQVHVIRALRAGALSYLLKDSTPEQLVTAIRLAARGKSTITPPADPVRRLGPAGRDRSGALADLTERELQILRAIADGISNALIAEQLTIAEGTVKTHVNHILTKLNVKDRTQAAVLAWKAGLAEPDP